MIIMPPKFPTTPSQWYDLLALLGGREDNDRDHNIPLAPQLHDLKQRGILRYLVSEHLEGVYGIDVRACLLH
jgi:hypothetical protein